MTKEYLDQLCNYKLIYQRFTEIKCLIKCWRIELRLRLAKAFALLFEILLCLHNISKSFSRATCAF